MAEQEPHSPAARSTFVRGWRWIIEYATMSRGSKRAHFRLRSRGPEAQPRNGTMPPD